MPPKSGGIPITRSPDNGPKSRAELIIDFFGPIVSRFSRGTALLFSGFRSGLFGQAASRLFRLGFPSPAAEKRTYWLR